MYEKIMEAALAETASKFRLAEALYEEIDDPGSGAIGQTFYEVAEIITEAGGEPRSAIGLRQFWMTARYFWDYDAQKFAWRDGASFSAHNHARMAKMSVEDFHKIEYPIVEEIGRIVGVPRGRTRRGLELAILKFADSVDRYTEVDIGQVHWVGLLSAYEQAKLAMAKLGAYIDTGR
jgi:hypothetical protein